MDTRQRDDGTAAGSSLRGPLHARYPKRSALSRCRFLPWAYIESDETRQVAGTALPVRIAADPRAA
jgi:hypothetical protein